MAKVLVTGGAGFVGSNLVERLSRNNRVIVLDNFHTGDRKNLNSLGVEVVETDCGNVRNLGLSGIEKIFHVGIYSASPMYRENHQLVGKVINEFIEIMDFARENRAKVVFASSSSVYSGLEPPHREDMEIRVTDYYTEARLCIERIAKLYHLLYGVKSIGLRFFSVYGPKEESKGRYANLISQFIWAMKKGEAPVIYGDGKQTRDFIYVEDVVDAIIKAMDSDISCDIFNVGTGRSISLNELVEILNRMLKTDIKPRHIENPIKNYVPHTQADTTKIRNVLGFSPKFSLEEGIKKLIKYYG
jgi:UDP-glucose 4-epimerase